jgi:hypothetical protein
VICIRVHRAGESKLNVVMKGYECLCKSIASLYETQVRMSRLRIIGTSRTRAYIDRSIVSSIQVVVHDRPSW